MDSNEEKFNKNREENKPTANKGASSSLPEAETEKTRNAQRPPKTAAELAMAGVDTGESSVRESVPEENELALEKEIPDVARAATMPEEKNSENEAYSWEHFAEYEYEEEYKQPAKGPVYVGGPGDDTIDEPADSAEFAGETEEPVRVRVETAKVTSDVRPSEDADKVEPVSHKTEAKASSPDSANEDPSDGLLSIEEFERQGKAPEKPGQKAADEGVHRQKKVSETKGEELAHSGLDVSGGPVAGPSTNDYINKILSELDGKTAKETVDLKTAGADTHTTKRIFRAKGREPDIGETSAPGDVLSLDDSEDRPEKPVVTAEKVTEKQEAQGVDARASKHVFRAKGREPDAADLTDDGAFVERLSLDEPGDKAKETPSHKTAPDTDDEKPDAARGFVPEETAQEPGKNAVASSIAEFHAQAGLLGENAGQAAATPAAASPSAKGASGSELRGEDGETEETETIEQKIPPGKYVYTAKNTKRAQPEEPFEREEVPEKPTPRETRTSEPAPATLKVEREALKEPPEQKTVVSEPWSAPLEASERVKAQDELSLQKSKDSEPPPVLEGTEQEKARSKPTQRETQNPEPQTVPSKAIQRDEPAEKPLLKKEEASEPLPPSLEGPEREETGEKPSPGKPQALEASPAPSVSPKVQEKDTLSEKPQPKKVEASEPSPAPSKAREVEATPEEPFSKKTKFAESSPVPPKSEEGEVSPEEASLKKTKLAESSPAPPKTGEREASTEEPSPKKTKLAESAPAPSKSRVENAAPEEPSPKKTKDAESSSAPPKAGEEEASPGKPTPKKIRIAKAPTVSAKAQESAAESKKGSVKKSKADQPAPSKAAKKEESPAKETAPKPQDAQPSPASPKPLKPPPPPQTASRPFSFLKKTEKLALDEDSEQPKQKRNIHEYGRMSIALFGVCIGVAFLILFMGSWMMVALNIKPSNPVMDTGYDDPLIDIHEIPLDNEGLPTTEIIAMAAPSVVSLVTYGSNNQDPLGNGSGIILTEDGYIATNAHVIGDAQTVRVTLDSGDAFTAEIMGKDEQNDIALLKINATGLVPAEFANPDSLRRGQRVVAIGNAAGMLSGTPSLGIISGVNRELTLPLEDDLEVEMPLIQTDAAINPGSSGGALVNVHGQVVGMIVTKLPDAGIDNIGFAIPANIVQASVEGMQQYGDVSPAPELGITVMSLDETNAPDAAMPTEGLLISGLAGGSELEKQGVSVWDILLEADGVPLLTQADLATALSGRQPGDTVLLRVHFAQTGEEREITVPLMG